MSTSDDLLAFRYLAEEMSPQEQADFEARLLDDEHLAECLADSARLLVALNPVSLVNVSQESTDRHQNMDGEVHLSTAGSGLSRNRSALGRKQLGARAFQLAVVAAVFVCGLLLGRWTERSESGNQPALAEGASDLQEPTPATLRESGATIASAWLHLQEQPADDSLSPVELGELDAMELPSEFGESDTSAPTIPAWLIAAVQSDESRGETEPASEIESEREAL